MKDLTERSIPLHILTLAVPVALSMLAQIAYQLVDLYFIARLGVAATAGVNAAGNTFILVTALTQVLIVGTVATIAHAAGRKDQAGANLLFNQSMGLALICGAVTAALLCLFARSYMRSVAADSATAEAGVEFICWAAPGFALTLSMSVLSSALRGIGIVHPSIAMYVLTVLVNCALAPILIVGWGTGIPLGARGAGLATSLSVLIGFLALGFYFHRLQRFLAVSSGLLRPRLHQWWRILGVGLPAGGEFAFAFAYGAVVYLVIRNFGASAQAGFGIGSRVLQTILLPGMSIAFAAGPIAGQNFAANKRERVMETFRTATLIGTVVMLTTMLLVQHWARELIRMFGLDTRAEQVATVFLQLMSWSFVAQGLVYTCSMMFQGLGNTVPALISSGVRFLLFAVPAVWLSGRSELTLESLWYLSIATIVLQAGVSLWLLSIEMRVRLLPAASEQLS